MRLRRAAAKRSDGTRYLKLLRRDGVTTVHHGGDREPRLDLTVALPVELLRDRLHPLAVHLPRPRAVAHVRCVQHHAAQLHLREAKHTTRGATGVG